MNEKARVPGGDRTPNTGIDHICSNLQCLPVSPMQEMALCDGLLWVSP